MKRISLFPVALLACLVGWCSRGNAHGGASSSVLVVAGDNYEEFHAFRHFADPQWIARMEREGWRVGECSWDALRPETIERFNAVIFLQTPDTFIKPDRDAQLQKMKATLRDYLAKGGGVAIFPDLFRGTVHKTVNAWLEDYGLRADPQTIRERPENVSPFRAYPAFGVALTTNIVEHSITKGIRSFAYPIGNELSTGFVPGSEWKVLVRAGADAFTTRSEGVEEKGEVIPSAPPLVAAREAGGGRMAYWSGHSSFWVLRPFHAYWDNGRLLKEGDGFQLLNNLLQWLANTPDQKVGGFQKGDQAAIYRHLNHEEREHPQKYSLPGRPRRGVIGARSELSGGTSATELCRKARELGLDFLVFTEDASVVSDDKKWAALMEACATETSETFIAFPGVEVQSPETNDRAVFFNMRKPWPETPWNRGEFDAFVRIGVNNAWRGVFGMLDPAAARVPVANQGAVSALAVKTFDLPAKTWKRADALFHRTQSELWGFYPLSYRPVRNLADLEEAAKDGSTALYAAKWGRRFAIGQDEIAFSAVSDGPVLERFDVAADSTWSPPFSNTYRGKVRLTHLHPDDRVEVWFNHARARRFVPVEGQVAEAFHFSAQGAGSLFIRVLDASGATRLQTTAYRIAKLRFSSFVGSDRMNGYWYPARHASAEAPGSLFLEGGYAQLGTTIYPQLGWGDHWLFRSENQLETQPMGFEVGAPPGTIERLFTGFYVRRGADWEMLAPWRGMQFASSDAVVWGDDSIQTRREPRLNGRRTIIVEPSPDLERTASVAGFRWDQIAAWRVSASVSLKPGVSPDNVPRDHRILAARLGDPWTRFASIQIRRSDGRIDEVALEDGAHIALSAGEGITLGDAPMGSVSVWPLQDLTATILRESGKPVLSLQLPEGSWPPTLGEPLRADYLVVVSVHRDGQPAPNLEGVAKELFSTARWMENDDKASAEPLPGEAYCQTVELDGRGSLGTWKNPGKPWRVQIAGYENDWELGVLFRSGDSWNWHPVERGQKSALAYLPEAPEGKAFVGHPFLGDDNRLVLRATQWNASTGAWTVTLHNPTDSRVTTRVVMHPALRPWFALPDRQWTLAPGATETLEVNFVR